jgi:Tfp pilus assembly protein PilX
MGQPNNPGSCVPAHQRGVATLFVVLMLLLAAGLVMLYTSRGAVMEQRLSANEIRAKQAVAAANAGLDRALSLVNDPTGGIGLVKFFNSSDQFVAPTTALAPTSPFGTGTSTYLVKYCNITTNADALSCGTTRGSSTTCASPDMNNLVDALMFSCGWSDDDSAAHKMTQKLRVHPGLAGTISTPLITKGTANLLVGGASVLNYFNDLTVWSGGSMLGQSMTGKTFTRDVATYPTPDASVDYRDTGNSPACSNPPTGYTCSTQGSTLGHDTVTGDTRLSSLSADGFFEYFFGDSLADYRDQNPSWKIDLNNSLSNENSTDINSIGSYDGNIIWVEGDATSLPDTIGSQEHPVLLIVNGDLELGSNTVINGLVYVQGDVTGNGSPTIYGSLIVQGTANTTGNPKIIYDPNVIKRTEYLGTGGKLQGSWKDW